MINLFGARRHVRLIVARKTFSRCNNIYNNEYKGMSVSQKIYAWTNAKHLKIISNYKKQNWSNKRKL